MKTQPIETLESLPTDEKMEEAIEAIPDGHTISLQAIMDETGMSSRQAWLRVAGDRCISRVYRGRPCSFFVNRKTRKTLLDE